MDMISSLPDDLIVTHIVSFLSAKAAACLMCTSKKWANLLTVLRSAAYVGCYSFEPRLKNFADELASARDAIHRLRRFSLKLGSLDFAQYSTVSDCLRDAFKCGVFDLELDVNFEGDFIDYSLPSEIFTCKSVVKMKLGSGFVIDIIPSNALLPALKTLLLDSVRFDGIGGCAFTRLLSACPVLEELVIDGFNCELWNWSHTVSSQILRRLTIRRAYSEDEDYHQEYEFERISFDTPSLAYLEYDDYIHEEFPVVNLDSLVEATLNFSLMTASDETDPTNLFKGLENVQILRLDTVDTMQVFEAGIDTATVFENMSHLYMPTEADVCWDGLKVFVTKSPNLKTLTIEALHYTYDSDEKAVCECLEDYSFLLTCPVEILKITQFDGYVGEMVQVKHVLEKLQCLVLLEVHVQATSDEKKLQILDDLSMLPRVSSKCKVEVKFGYTN
ncbi:PREDICTED: F-box protein At3g62430-like [Camelina sativa]|uniref:F-box protein At3g62430-like n=1 Tax=Camelina sativa TaxID=90675 RepID=A0ABM1RRW1_CAMSA|nr:PREDICTED: F-box protein At3g62430-like [Camelina sativa]XP_019101748.1 PREDICTED: F-box protein At3g62430-like [Camelina sativa]XP_019101749.1 PREDICTED: F-box protein At3g62430-like [Camelina sativa]